MALSAYKETNHVIRVIGENGTSTGTIPMGDAIESVDVSGNVIRVIGYHGVTSVTFTFSTSTHAG